MQLLTVYCYSLVLIGLVSLVPCHWAASLAHPPPMKDYIDGTETWPEEDRHKNDPFFMDFPEIRKKEGKYRVSQKKGPQFRLLYFIVIGDA
ncbi:hypothetical protein Ddc_14856 [Ditylenchus destructor]|nr:hypothetical protein Ddc_14856 [Ditylenchus destructor]